MADVIRTADENDFAKLFGVGANQVLVKIDEGDKGPEVRFWVRPPGLGVCSIAFDGWANDDTGWAKARKVFDAVTEQSARDMGSRLLAALTESDDE